MLQLQALIAAAASSGSKHQQQLQANERLVSLTAVSAATCTILTPSVLALPPIQPVAAFC